MSVLDQLKGGLVVSCQPVDDGPMDDVGIVVAMAQAAVAGGAIGLRIEGIEKVRAVCRAVDVPIIGIVKRDLGNSPIRITVSSKDVQNLAEAGAEIVAFDATYRTRPESIESLAQTANSAQVLWMADCATLEEGRKALLLGADIIGTTLSGYTADTATASTDPDFGLLAQFAELSAHSQSIVMAEGRFNTPHLVSLARKAGADCVTVGSAITRIEHIVAWFGAAMKNSDS